MARKLKKSKVSICVFCEGESEQAYTDFLKSKFQDVAVFKRPSSTGLFEEADNRFKKDPKYRDYSDVFDEIWFFFDVEENTDERNLWLCKNCRTFSTVQEAVSFLESLKCE